MVRLKTVVQRRTRQYDSRPHMGKAVPGQEQVITQRNTMKPKYRTALMFAFILAAILSGPAFGFYSPQEGRWLARDPIGEKASHNLYSILRNDSVNRIDLYGLWGLAPGDPIPLDPHLPTPDEVFIWQQISDSTETETFAAGDTPDPDESSCAKEGIETRFYEKGDLMDRYINDSNSRFVGDDERYNLYTRETQVNYRLRTAVCNCLCHDPDRECKWHTRSAWKNIWLKSEKTTETVIYQKINLRGYRKIPEVA